ncbi:MAG TPA: hypothetical protein VHM26_10575 [Chitinophagaceae bacterium]|jgi:hypothetical protein|nr:hypothetical protein [Chitinophagaceae bacterium]
MVIFRIISVLFTAIAFAPGFAHLLERKPKLDLSRSDYLITQQLYAGWALFGIIIFIALIATVIVAIRTKWRMEKILAWSAAILIVTSLVLFFIHIYPANQQTFNWSFLPDNWIELQQQWEDTHALNAILYGMALLLLIISLAIRKQVNISERS